MSTKSKRRIARRAGEQGNASPASIGPNTQHKIEGQIVGALLNAITFGVVDGPQSARAPQSPKHATEGAPQTG